MTTGPRFATPLCLVLCLSSCRVDAWSPVSKIKCKHPLLPRRYTTTALQSTADPSVQFALYEEQQRSMMRTAQAEADILQENGDLPDVESFQEVMETDPEAYKTKIKELRKQFNRQTKKKKKASAGRGFGGDSSAKDELPKLAPVSNELLELGLAQASVLAETGVVRINSALSRETAAKLRAAVLQERADGEAAVAAGSVPSSKRFADLNFSANRRDVLLPLADSPCAPAVVTALTELFGPTTGTLRALYEIVVGHESVLYEIASLISEPGAAHQTIHSDMPYQDACAIYTGFLALQDITRDMGPTTFLPGTHTPEAHAKLQNPMEKEDFLRSSGPRQALLKAGDIAIFDSRGMHAGGKNLQELGSTRALFYFSFTNPEAGKFERGVNMASMRPGYSVNPITLGQICRAVSGKVDIPFADRGDGLGSEGDELTEKRETFRRQRNAPDGSL